MADRAQFIESLETRRLLAATAERRPYGLLKVTGTGGCDTTSGGAGSDTTTGSSGNDSTTATNTASTLTVFSRRRVL